MCYLIREEQAEPEPKGTGATPPSLRTPRPRWIAAGALAIVGGLALAGLVTPGSLPEQPVPKHTAAAAKITPVSTEKVVEHLTLGADDGVPSTSDLAKARAHDCMEGL